MRFIATSLLALLVLPLVAQAELLHRGMGVGLFLPGKMGNTFTVLCTPQNPSYALYRQRIHTKILLKGYVTADPGSNLRASCYIQTSPPARTAMSVIPMSQPNKNLIRGYYSFTQSRSAILPPIFRVICHTNGAPGYADLNFAMGMNNLTQPGFVGLDFSCNLVHNPATLYYSYR